jgi:dUTP pyrophosphatase
VSTVYFAEPIDFDPIGCATRDAIYERLVTEGYTVYRPKMAWAVGNAAELLQVARAIDGVNRQAIRRSAAVVAFLPQGVPTHGVPAEIEFATRHLGIRATVVGTTGVAILSNGSVTVLNDPQTQHQIGTCADLVIQQVKLDVQASKREYLIDYSGPLDLQIAHHGDAGIDLVTSEDVAISPGHSTLLPTGTRLRLPEGTFGWVVARSSTHARWGLLVLPGIIDEGFTGEIGVSVVNIDATPTTVRAGSRVAQLVIMGNMLRGFGLRRVGEDEVHKGRATTRGSNGFGSTG